MLVEGLDAIEAVDLGTEVVAQARGKEDHEVEGDGYGHPLGDLGFIAGGRAVYRAEGDALALEALESAYLSAVEAAD